MSVASLTLGPEVAKATQEVTEGITLARAAAIFKRIPVWKEGLLEGAHVQPASFPLSDALQTSFTLLLGPLFCSLLMMHKKH